MSSLGSAEISVGLDTSTLAPDLERALRSIGRDAERLLERAMRLAGEAGGEGATDGVEDGLDDLVRITRRIADRAGDALGDGFSEGSRRARDELDEIGDAAERTERRTRQAFSSISSGIGTGIGFGLVVGGFSAITNAASAAARAVSDFIGSSINEAGDLAEAIDFSATVFGDSQQVILDFAETAVTELGAAESQVITFANTFGNLVQGMGASEIEATASSMEVFARATDVASAQNRDLQEVLDAVTSGIAGESEPLRRLGVDTRAAALEQYALENGLIAAGQEMDQATTRAAILGQFLAQTENQAGNFADTVGNSLPNQLRVLDAAFASVQASFGEGFRGISLSLLQEVTPALQELTSFASGVADSIATELSEPAARIGAAFAAIPASLAGLEDTFGGTLGTLADAFADVFEGVAEFLPTLLEGFGVFGEIIESVSESFGGDFGTALSEIATAAATLLAVLNPVQAILGGAFVALLPRLGELVQGLQPLVTLLSDVGRIFAEALGPPIVDLVLTIGGALGELATAATPLLTTLGEVLGNIATTLGGVLGQAIEALVPVFSTLLEGVEPLVGLLGDVLVEALEALSPIIPPLGQALEVLAGAAIQLLEGFSPLLGVVPPLIEAGVGLLLAFEPLIEPVTQLALVAAEMLTAFTPLLPVLAELLATLASEAVAPIIQGIAEAVGFLIGKFADLVELGLPFITGFVDVAVEALSDFSDFFRRIARSVGLALEGDFASAFSSFNDPLGPATNNIVNSVARWSRATAEGSASIQALATQTGLSTDLLAAGFVEAGLSAEEFSTRAVTAVEAARIAGEDAGQQFASAFGLSAADLEELNIEVGTELNTDGLAEQIEGTVPEQLPLELRPAVDPENQPSELIEKSLPLELRPAVEPAPGTGQGSRIVDALLGSGTTSKVEVPLTLGDVETIDTRTLVDRIGQDARQALAGVNFELPADTEQLNPWAPAIAGLDELEARTSGTQIFDTYVQVIEPATTATENFGAAVEGLETTTFNDVFTLASDTAPVMEDLNVNAGEFGETMAELVPSLEGADESFSTFLETTGGSGDVMSDAATAIGGGVDDIDRELQALSRAADSATDDFDKALGPNVERAVDGAVTAAEPLGGEVEEAITQPLVTAATNATDAFEGELVGGVEGAVTRAEGAGGDVSVNISLNARITNRQAFISSIASEIRAAVQAAVAQSGTSGVGTSGSSSGGAPDADGDGIPDSIDGTPFGAYGGIFRSAQKMIIGEAGTEVLLPITRPGRAMDLLQESGFLSYIQRRLQSPPVVNVAPAMAGAPSGAQGASQAQPAISQTFMLPPTKNPEIYAAAVLARMNSRRA